MCLSCVALPLWYVLIRLCAGGCRFDTLSGCVLVVLDESRETEISDFTDEFLRYQDVGGSQVSVDVVLILNVSHSIRHLQGAAAL